jgi:hypothetical protein
MVYMNKTGINLLLFNIKNSMILNNVSVFYKTVSIDLIIKSFYVGLISLIPNK